MTQLPIDDDTLAGIVKDVSERLHLHSPEMRVKASALISAGVLLLAKDEGEAGLDRAAYAAQVAIRTAAQSLGIGEARQ